MEQQQQQSSQTRNHDDGNPEQHAPSQQQQQHHPPDSPGNMFIMSGGGHSHHSSVRSNGSPSPRAASSSSSSSTISCLSPSGAASPSHGELVLRGSGGGVGDSSLIAFTGALREMLRTNSVRASRQAAINETNAQLHAMHFMLGYCNAERSMRLQREYESVRAQIEEGRTILAQMGSVIASQDLALASLGSSLTAMEERASETAGRVAGVEDELAAQKAALASAMAEYEQRLAAQEREMRAQEASLARLLSVRFRIDFGLDVLMALLSWYLAHNGLVALVAQYLGQNVLFRSVAGGRRTRNRYTRHTVSAVQIVLFLALLRRMRRFALEQGLHHAIGSYSKYAQFVARMCGSTIEIVRGQGSAALSLRDPADEEDAAVVAHARERERIQTGGASEATGGAHTDAASSLHATVLPAVNGVAPDPDFSSSAAVSLGRSVGSALVAGLRSGRDSVRWMLRRVVATGAAEDMEIDSGNSATATANSAAAAAAANSGSASAAHSHPAPQPVHHTPGDVQGARSGTHTPTPTQSQSQPFHPLPHPHPHHYSASAFHTPSSSHGLDHSFSASPYGSAPGYVPASAPPSFDHTQMLLSHMHAEPLLPPPSILFTPSAPPQPHANTDCE